jgi:hypothetical protein
MNRTTKRSVKRMLRPACLLLALGLAAFPTAARGQERPVVSLDPACGPWGLAGWFIGTSVDSQDFRGDFDGRLVLGDAKKVFFIPGPERGAGLAFFFGRIHRRGLWALSFLRSTHDVTFRGGRSDASFNVIALDAKAYVLPASPVTPYVQVGLTVPWFRVRDGSTYVGELRDATYLGLGVNGGLGLLIHLGSSVYISGGAVARGLAFLYAYGEGSEGRDVQNLRVDQSGPLRKGFLKVYGLGWEVGIGFRI